MTVEKDEESHKMKPNPMLTLKYSVLLTTALLILSLCMLILPSKRQTQFLSQPVTYGQNLEYYDIDEVFDPHLNEDIMDKEENELDGCYHVYLDVGSNVGNQIRKLYEPDLFVNASVLPIFDKYFGDPGVRQEKGTVCAIGFEPNSHHTSILQKIQSAYNLCDWKVKLFTETAAAHSYGLATYYSDHNSDWREWGGSIVHSKIAKHPAGVAKMIRLSDYILKKVITRKLPSFLSLEAMNIKPNVVMKMDIEGSELEVLTDLVVTGALQHIDLALMEYHSQSFYPKDFRSSAIKGLEKAIDTLNYLSRTLRLKNVFNVKEFNDESYATVNYPLPECSML